MKSLTTPDFWMAYSALPSEIKAKAHKAYQLWKENQAHPSLHFKQVGRNLWSARITYGHLEKFKLHSSGEPLRRFF